MTDEKKPQMILRSKAHLALQGSLKGLILLAELDPVEIVANCISCDHFDEPNEICAKYKARPPARVIAHGCVSWDNLDEDVPF